MKGETKIEKYRSDRNRKREKRRRKRHKDINGADRKKKLRQR
jgi:hypothetical protein